MVTSIDQNLKALLTAHSVDINIISGLHSTGTRCPERSGQRTVRCGQHRCESNRNRGHRQLRNTIERTVAQLLLDITHKLVFRNSEDLCQIPGEVQPNSNKKITKDGMR